jgi:hypothetical protein
MIDLPATLTPLVEQLLPALRGFSRGEYGIALGGSHAKGVADERSDLDLYVFAREVLPNEERTRLIERLPGVTGIVSWGQTEPFIQAGTDFYLARQKVEVWLRNADYMADTIGDCRAGIVRHDMVTWTVMGFYNHCALSDVSKMRALEDPYGILARWQAAVSEYPPELRDAIIGRHMQAARFWPGNFHCLSAVERGDVIYVAGIVQQVVDNLIQVLFALNRVYFPGEKKLAAALDHLPVKPEAFVARIERLVFPAATAEVGYLGEQSRELAALVEEVCALVASDTGDRAATGEGT